MVGHGRPLGRRIGARTGRLHGAGVGSTGSGQRDTAGPSTPEAERGGLDIVHGELPADHADVRTTVRCPRVPLTGLLIPSVENEVVPPASRQRNASAE